MGTKSPLMIAKEIPVSRAKSASLIQKTPWIPATLIISYLFPAPIQVAGLVLSPTRIILLLLLVPSILKLAFGSAKICAIDILILVHVLWVVVSFAVSQGLDQAIKSGGVYAIEVLGSYLVGRCFINKLGDSVGIVTLLCAVVMITAPLACIETFFGYSIFRLFGDGPVQLSGQRFGLYRAQGPFPNAILYGCFCASVLSLVTYTFPLGLRKLTSQAVIMIATASSVSSGALAMLTVQFGLMTWGELLKKSPRKWEWLLLMITIAYAAVALLSNRTPIMVALSYLTFDPATAFYRTIIFQYGSQSAIDHPMFGIGFGDWNRPLFMYSSSIDDYWLVIAVRHGIPAFMTLFLATIICIYNNLNGNSQSQRLRLGYNFSLIAFIVGACTVDLWGNLLVQFSFMLGWGTAVAAAS